MNTIIHKYLEGKATPEEQKELLDWLRQAHNQSLFQSRKELWKLEHANEPVPAEYHPVWMDIQERIYKQMQSNFVQTNRMMVFFRYAAIFLLILLLPSLIYMATKSSDPGPLVYTTVVADFGQISKVVMPDSSVIWVNSGSTIKYNNRYATTNRDIDLVGEAFFKVKKNTDLPLVVKNANLCVKVLGTEFSVSAYPEESTIQVVLEKGKVELSSTSDVGFRSEMKPGELAAFNKKKRELSLTSVNTELYTSWKDGLINIYNLPLSELVVRLERRYNQKFLVEDAIKKMHFTFTIKNEDLSSVLKLIERITPIVAVQKGNIIELRLNKK